MRYVSTVTAGDMARVKTHPSEIHLHQVRQTVKAIVQRRHVTAHDQEDDTGVVELVSPLGNVRAVVAERVERGAHAQAAERAREETREREYVRLGGAGVAGQDDRLEEVQRGEPRRGEGEGAEEVRPDVHRLVMQGEERGQRAQVAVARGSVTGGDVGVVTPPLLEVVPGQKSGGLDLLLNGLCRVQDGFSGG